MNIENSGLFKKEKEHACFTDLTGKKFGKLTVIEFSSWVIAGKDLEKKVSSWKCLCDCGNEKIVWGVRLKNGNTKSCGCLKIEQAIKSGKESFKGNGVSGFNCLRSKYNKNASKRNLEFSLSNEQLVILFKGNCSYCGNEPMQQECKGDGAFIYNGIDRINNTKGYVFDNCASCCKWCNQAKSTLTKEEFLNHIKKIYANMKMNENQI